MNKTKAEIVFQVGMVVQDVEKTIENLKTYFELDEESIVRKSKKRLSRASSQKTSITVCRSNST